MNSQPLTWWRYTVLLLAGGFIGLGVMDVKYGVYGWAIADFIISVPLALVAYMWEE